MQAPTLGNVISGRDQFGVGLVCVKRTPRARKVLFTEIGSKPITN